MTIDSRNEVKSGPENETEPYLPVSVIIPCYRAAATVGRALASVLSQTRLPAEVILVDDGSDDRTAEVLVELAEKYGRPSGSCRLRVFSLAVNRGPAAARNYAWEQAGFPYLAFLDADDGWQPAKLEIQYKFMRTHPEFDFCGHFCDRVEGKNIVGDAVAFREICLEKLLLGNVLRTPTMMIRRELDLRFPEDRRYGEDFAFWLGLLASGRRAALLEYNLARTFKPAFGDSGQSAALWAMEKAELRALSSTVGRVSFDRRARALGWSLLKFLRRLLLTWWRKCRSVDGVILSADKRPLQVLFLVTDDWFFLLHRRALALAVKETGARVMVATAPGPRIDEIKALGFEHYLLPLYRSSRNPLREIFAGWKIYRLYQRLQPDLVHQVSIKPILYGSPAARLARVPAVVNAVTGLGYVFIDGGRGKALLRRLVEKAYRLAAGGKRVRFLFENPDDRRLFLARKILEPPKTRLILGSGVDCRRFRPHYRDAVNQPPKILLAARLLWDKGLAEYAEAARLLRKRGLEADFLLAGMPDKDNPAAVPASRLLFWQRQGLIRWLGYQRDMPELYRRVDIVVLPTRYREGIPVTLLEAAAAGKPLIATDMPGCREIVVPGKNGLLVRPGDATGLAEALAVLLTNDNLRRHYGRAGRRLVEEKFSDEIVIKATFSVYSELLVKQWPQTEKS